MQTGARHKLASILNLVKVAAIAMLFVVLMWLAFSSSFFEPQKTKEEAPVLDRASANHAAHVQTSTGYSFDCPVEPSDILILVIPGGSYARIALSGDPTHFMRELRRLRPATAFAVLTYTAPPESPWQPLEQVQRSFDRIVGTARVSPDSLQGACNLKPRFLVGVAGFSAGGHLACMLAQHVALDFMILMYPVVTMIEKYAHRRSKANLLARELIGRPGDAQLRVIRMFSAELHVENLPLKVWLVASRNDATVSYKNTALLYRALYARQDGRWANMSSRRPRQHYEHLFSLVRMKLYPYGVHGHFGDGGGVSLEPGAPPTHQSFGSKDYVLDMLPWLVKVTSGYDADAATFHPDMPLDG
jgi:acetyl esterase/lipase